MESTNSDLSAPLSDASRQAVGRICAHIAKDLPDISDEIVRRIRAEIPDSAVVPLGDHRQFGPSVAAAARALHLHPNSPAYGLSRWQELTGFERVAAMDSSRPWSRSTSIARPSDSSLT